MGSAMQKPGRLTGTVLGGVCLVTLAMCAAGCQTSPQVEMGTARTAFEGGDFDRAYRSASHVAGRRNDAIGVEAAYIAGVSAYRLDRPDNAERYLRMAAYGVRGRATGSALAMLGVVYVSQGSYDRASSALLSAAEQLDGQDRANAYYYAARAAQKLHRWAEARNYLTLARSTSTDPGFRRAVAAELSNTGWTIQIGAYADEASAQAAADELAANHRTGRIGVTRVVVVTDDDGKGRYMIRIGEFSTYVIATEKRRELGIADAIVVAMDAEPPK